MAQILIVDDEAALRRSLRRTLERARYVVADAANVTEAREMLAAEPVELVFCDINMPGESGLELVRTIAGDGSDTAVIMLSGIDDPAVAREALMIGAHGYLVKPISPNEALIAVASALRRRELELERRAYVRELESKVLTRTSALRDALQRLERTQASARYADRDAVARLVTALTLRSEETGAHIQRVGLYSQLLARRSGVNSRSEEEIRFATMLHDVGKIGIPDSILLKPGPLTASEFEIIKRHPALGSSLLAQGESAVLRLGAEVALAHHERWDGEGYPLGISGAAIPVCGRVAAIADVFDALTSDRVYRAAMPIGDALELMHTERGRHFDPGLVDVFVSSAHELAAIRSAHPD